MTCHECSVDEVSSRTEVFTCKVYEFQPLALPFAPLFSVTPPPFQDINRRSIPHCVRKRCRMLQGALEVCVKIDKKGLGHRIAQPQKSFRSQRKRVLLPGNCTRACNLVCIEGTIKKGAAVYWQTQGLASKRLFLTSEKNVTFDHRFLQLPSEKARKLKNFAHESTRAPMKQKGAATELALARSVCFATIRHIGICRCSTR